MEFPVPETICTDQSAPVPVGVRDSLDELVDLLAGEAIGQFQFEPREASPDQPLEEQVCISIRLTSSELATSDSTKRDVPSSDLDAQ
jgi:hypothetical protein